MSPCSMLTCRGFGTRPSLGPTSRYSRRRWRTRIELANAIFEYLEIFHNRQRRHTALGMRTPIEYERNHYNTTTVTPLIQVS